MPIYIYIYSFSVYIVGIPTIYRILTLFAFLLWTAVSRYKLYIIKNKNTICDILTSISIGFYSHFVHNMYCIYIYTVAVPVFLILYIIVKKKNYSRKLCKKQNSTAIYQYGCLFYPKSCFYLIIHTETIQSILLRLWPLQFTKYNV